MTEAHPLDRPVWNTLRGAWATHALGSPDCALRLDPRIWPFAALADESARSRAALGELMLPGETVSLIEPRGVEAFPGVTVQHLELIQMSADHAPQGEAPPAVRLGAEDATDMAALAALTRPGPFSTDTHRLGRFIGVREGGRLVAMAGERMRVTGYGEVSGVCTHPDAQGRGYARGLMLLVMRRIVERGERLFLHVHGTNESGIALHRSMGFVARRDLTHTILTRG